jgi:hypothetical protein
MEWNEYRHRFNADLTVGMISIENTCLQDWQLFYDFLTSTSARLSFLAGGQITSLPSLINHSHFNQGALFKLIIYLDDCLITCPLTDSSKITLYYKPKEIISELKAKVLFRLMSTAGRTLDKTVNLYSEPGCKKAVFSYRPGSGLKYRD